MVLLAAVLVSGCASALSAVGQTPQRVQDALGDPVRRVHVAAQVGLEASTAVVAITCAAYIPLPLSLGICPVVALLHNFVIYEFVLEPVSKTRVERGEPSLVGPYWERGPHTDLGEVFVNP